MCRKSICLILFVLAVVTATAHADKLSGLADVTVVDGAIVSFRYEGAEYVVADEDLILGTTTRWYVPASGVETLWVDGTPTPAATVSGTSTVKANDIGPNADNWFFAVEGDADNISSIDGIDFQQTIFPFLASTFFHFERGGNDTGTWQAILADGSLGAPVAFSGASDYANTGVDVAGQIAYGVVFTTDVPVQGVRITASGHDTLSISIPVPLPVLAALPSPPDGATDVPREAVLSWTPGIFAPAVNGHRVYLSDSFNNVNDGIGGVTQDANSYAPAQRLDFETTYYWRVDEVNAPPDSTVFEGDVWSFTTEPIAYPIAGERITVTVSSQSENQGPENTVNGSGLDVNNQHSIEPTDMWLSGDEPNGAWIEYEFDKVCKLHEMWVWNHNGMMEPAIGLGFKDIAIEYSVNGTDYTTLGTTHEFARAPGTPDYVHNTTIDFGGVAAKYVRLTANSNWGEFLDKYGLSEVRFLYIPLRAREPQPESGAIDVDVDLVLSFRAGREAAEHNVYISTDEQAVIDSNVPVSIVTEAQDGPISLDLGETYYWKVNEVNMAETPTMLEGDIWNFTTHEFFVVDDFEDYNDWPPDEIWSTWVDGYGVPTNGATVGYPAPDFLAGEHYVETTIVHGGEQAMPFFYDNTGTAAYSEGERTFAVPQDWTKAGVQTLVLYFHGTIGNTGQLYVKVNGSKVVYDGDASNLARAAEWQAWNIDVASFGVSLQSVTTLAIGIDGSGASGTLYFDDIRLYRLAPEPPEEIWLEAEAADSITSPMNTYDDPLASGGQYIGTEDGIIGDEQDAAPADGVATYNFTVAGGIYKVLGLVKPDAGNSFWFRITTAISQTHEDPDQPGTGWVRWNDIEAGADWHWDEVHSSDHSNAIVNWTLPAGAHTLEIARREDGGLLDAILITDDVD